LKFPDQPFTVIHRLVPAYADDRMIIRAAQAVRVADLLAALLMRPEPVLPFQTHEDREFYDSYVNSRSMAVQRLKRTRQNLERRLQRLEHMVTAKEFDWESRLNDSPGNG